MVEEIKYSAWFEQGHLSNNPKQKNQPVFFNQYKETFYSHNQTDTVHMGRLRNG